MGRRARGGEGRRSGGTGAGREDGPGDNSGLGKFLQSNNSEQNVDKYFGWDYNIKQLRSMRGQGREGDICSETGGEDV